MGVNPPRRHSNPKCDAQVHNKVAKYVTPKLIELKGEIDKYAIIIRDCNTSQQFDKLENQCSIQ